MLLRTRNPSGEKSIVVAFEGNSAGCDPTTSATGIRTWILSQRRQTVLVVSIVSTMMYLSHNRLLVK